MGRKAGRRFIGTVPIGHQKPVIIELDFERVAFGIVPANDPFGGVPSAKQKDFVHTRAELTQFAGHLHEQTAIGNGDGKTGFAGGEANQHFDSFGLADGFIPLVRKGPREQEEHRIDAGEGGDGQAQVGDSRRMKASGQNGGRANFC